MKFSNIFSFFKRNKKKVDILDYKTAIDYIINNEVSISRYGDGEFFLIMDRDIPFQTASPKLKERLIEILTSENPNLLVGVSKVMFHDDENAVPFVRDFHKNFRRKKLKKIMPYISESKTYIPTEISSLYQTLYNEKFNFEEYFDNIKNIWKNKDITIICGENTFKNITNNIFDCAKSVEYIYAPSKNAFDEYETLLSEYKKLDKSRLLIIILGPTATVLAYDLQREGFRVLDFGHIAKDYDSFLKKKGKNEEDIAKFMEAD